MSGVHFQLFHDDSGCRVVDLNSRNGTVVNGSRITETTLRNGDIIRAGQTTFGVAILDDEPDAPLLAQPESPAANSRTVSFTRPVSLVERDREGAAGPDAGSGAEPIQVVLRIDTGPFGCPSAARPMPTLRSARIPACRPCTFECHATTPRASWSIWAA
jgi:hypothetical protein